MSANLKAVGGSELPLNIRKAEANILELACDEQEVILLARLTQLEAVEENNKHFLDLPKQIKFNFEIWVLTGYFDPEQPEWILRRTDEGTINIKDILAEDILDNVPDGSVMKWSENVKDLSFSVDYFDKLAEKVECLHKSEIEEWPSHETVFQKA